MVSITTRKRFKKDKGIYGTDLINQVKNDPCQPFMIDPGHTNGSKGIGIFIKKVMALENQLAIFQVHPDVVIRHLRDIKSESQGNQADKQKGNKRIYWLEGIS